jgi:hypothetical protein
MTTASRSARYRERHRRDPLFLYRCHRANAGARDIPFRLTFDQWWRLWERSGKWKQRGNRSENYCMARPGDKGAYEIGNVKICTNFENRAERCQNYPLRGKRNGAFGKDYWAAGTRAERKRRAAKVSAFMKGRKKGPQMRSRLSESTTGRRRITRGGRVTWAYPGDADYPGK